MQRESVSAWQNALGALRLAWEQGPEAERLRMALLKEVDSTNSWLLTNVPARSDPRTQVCVGYCQSAGRGRRGRSWLSAPGWGVTFSLGRWCQTELIKLPVLTLVLGLGLARGLRLCGYSGYRLKWPNDVCTESDAKLAGILLETHSSGSEGTWVVAGFGLNRGGAMTLQLDRVIADLSQLPGPKTITSAQLLSVVVPELLGAWDDFERFGPGPSIAEFAAWDALRGRRVQVVNGESAGVAVGVDPVSGALLLALDDGRTVAVHSGELSIDTGTGATDKRP